MPRNRDGKKGFKWSTRQTKIAGSLAFHRVNKLKKRQMHIKISPKK